MKKKKPKKDISKMTIEETMAYLEARSHLTHEQERILDRRERAINWHALAKPMRFTI